MASIIRIKRSSVSGNPNILGAGELAYSALNGAGGNRLYIGMGAETDGNAANHFVIGGTYCTGLVDASIAGTLTTSASSIPVLSATGTIDKWLVGNTQLTGNTLSSTNPNGNILITPNGSGKTVITNVFIGDDATSLTEFIQDVTGGTIADSTEIDATYDDTAGTTTLALKTTGVTAGVYGSSSAIPVITVDSKGRLTTVTTASITTSLSIAGDTGTDTIALATDTITFVGGTGITSTVNSVANSVTFDIDSTVATLTGTQTLTNKTLTSPVLTTPTLGAALATSITATSGNLTLAAEAGNNNVVLAPTGTGVVDVSSKRITNLAEPTQATDAATKGYVDAVAEGLHVHESAVVATTGTLATLSGGTVTYNNGTNGVGATLTLSAGITAIDGVTLTNGMRILVKDEATQAHNGMYVRTSATVLTRASDFDTAAEIAGGDFTFVELGTLYAKTGWVQTIEVLTVGTDNVIWQQFSGAGTFTAGNGLTLTGSEFNVGGTENRITVNPDSIDIASTYVGQTTITTLGTIGTGVWQGTLISPTYGGTGVNNGTKTITLGGNFTHSGAHTLTLTTTANTSVTLPITGTLATLGNTENLSNKTFTNTTFFNSNVTGAGAATSTLDGFNIDGGTY